MPQLTNASLRVGNAPAVRAYIGTALVWQSGGNVPPKTGGGAARCAARGASFRAKSLQKNGAVAMGAAATGTRPGALAKRGGSTSTLATASGAKARIFQRTASAAATCAALVKGSKNGIFSKLGGAVATTAAGGPEAKTRVRAGRSASALAATGTKSVIGGRTGGAAIGMGLGLLSSDPTGGFGIDAFGAQPFGGVPGVGGHSRTSQRTGGGAARCAAHGPKSVAVGHTGGAVARCAASGPKTITAGGGPAAVFSRTTGAGNTAATSHTITKPGGTTAQRGILVCFTHDTATANASTSSSGWVLLGTQAQGTTTNHTGSVFWAANSATAANLVVDLTASEEATWAVLLVDNPGAPEIVGTGGGSASTVGVPSLTTSGTGDYLGIVYVGTDSSATTTQTLSVLPSGYTNLQSQNPSGTSSAATFTCERAYASTSAITPGNATIGTSEQWVAFTIGFPGSGAGGSRPTTASRREFLLTSGADTLKMGYWSNGDLSATATNVTDLVFVIHGDNRDADNYVTYAMDSATLAGVDNTAEVLVVAPHFIADYDPGVSTTPSWIYWSDSGWKEGNLSQSDTYARPFRVDSFTALDSMILKAQTSFPNLVRVRVIGHSAGAQYINRYAAASTIPSGLAGIDIQFIIANPSSFLYLDNRRPHAPGGGLPGTTTSPVFSTLTGGESSACSGYDVYKYGLASGMNAYVAASTVAAIRTRYQTRKVIYLAGALDTDTSGGLDVTCEANWQGGYRLHRSANYFAYLALFYGSAPASHTRSVVAGVGHDASAMITSAEARAAMFVGGGGGGGGGAPLVRAVSTGGDSSIGQTSFTIAKPPGLTVNDYMFVQHVGDADTVLSDMTASGFSLLASQSGNVSNNYPFACLWGKVATSGDVSASTFTFGDSGSAGSCGIMIAIQAGTYQAGSPIAFGTWTTTPRTATVPQVVPSMPGIVDGLLLALFSMDGNSHPQTYPSGSPPSGMTFRGTRADSDSYAHAGMYSQALTSTAATGTKTVSPTGADTSENGWTTTAVIIKPA